MKTNFCFDFVIAVKEHDENVEKYAQLLGIEPIELAPGTLPEAGQRCTVFPLWNLEDRGMVLSIVSSSDPDSQIMKRVERQGEGVAMFGIDVDDVDAIMKDKPSGVNFLSKEPIDYDYGRMVFVDEKTTTKVPFFFSTHRKGWWQKSLAGGQD
jgi:hypothetical protein